jgi:hypothetical protein
MFMVKLPQYPTQVCTLCYISHSGAHDGAPSLCDPLPRRSSERLAQSTYVVDILFVSHEIRLSNQGLGKVLVNAKSSERCL